MVFRWKVWQRASLISLVVGAMVSCARADGEPGSTYTMMVLDDGVEMSPPLGVGREQPDMLSNTWYDYESNDLEGNFIYGNTAYRGSMWIEIDGEISNTAFEDGANAQDFYLLQYASTTVYVMYVFTERFDPAVGPDTTPIALLSQDGAGPISLESADFSSLPFGDPQVITFADDIPDTNGDGNGN